MVTLNQSLHQTSHHSLLVRKANRLHLLQIEDLVQLAVLRGCLHFRNVVESSFAVDPGQSALCDNELVILLLHGHYRYEPMAIRCAAQLLKSPKIIPAKITKLAICERCETPLKYIAEQGVRCDKLHRKYWTSILHFLGSRGDDPPPAVLPHQSRFMVNPGIQRGKKVEPFWLNPIMSNE